MSYKVLNQVNNIVSKLVTENAELKREIFILKNSKEPMEVESFENLNIINLASRILASEVAKVYLSSYSFGGELEYSDEGINYSHDKVFDYQFEEYYKDNKLWKVVPYDQTKELIKEFHKPHYDKMVEEAKMKWVREHKKEGKIKC